MVKVACDLSGSDLIDRFVYQYIKHSVDKPLSKVFKTHRLGGVSKIEEPKLFERLKKHFSSFQCDLDRKQEEENEVPEESKAKKKKIQCHVCQEFGHLSFACPQKSSSSAAKADIQCFKCKDYGHISFACPKTEVAKGNAFGKENKPVPGKGKYGKNLTCYNCNEIGHVSNECPQIQCYKCYEYGHFSSKCKNVTEATGSNNIPLGVRKTSSEAPDESMIS
eukprot:TRINITY_DN12835_c0_g1_i1.p1 TRINITY_DN12835_c0_g1~~TRINITY_DN12835_c0_g1_i1.p1  ORF type:complete len:221 (+),score=48.66 TRINITY_DN12835_c0_g1_i1:38-700(+)